MRVRHRILVDAVCPVNGDPDRYVCDVYPLTLLYCETVEVMARQATAEPVTQEQLTQRLANDLGCAVRTRGTHCKGRVETVVVCRPARQQGGRA
jgi:hypothetical protein